MSLMLLELYGNFVAASASAVCLTSAPTAVACVADVIYPRLVLSARRLPLLPLCLSLLQVLFLSFLTSLLLFMLEVVVMISGISYEYRQRVIL